MKRTITKSWMLAAAVLAVSAGAQARADEQVPFQAEYVSTISFTSMWTANLSGKGRATHLGSAGNDGSLVIVGPASCEGGFAVANVDTLTAANGDQLSVLITQQSCPAGAEGIYAGAGSYVVTGGTGRFAGATGGGTFSGIGDFNTAQVSCSLTGTVSAPGR